MADAAVKQENNRSNYPERREITLKFSKSCVKDTFVAKDGKTYAEIIIPNNEDKPWSKFAIPENRVHDDKYNEKVKWIKLPESGETTVRQAVERGRDEAGNVIWGREDVEVSNTELKAMVEFYKDDPERENPEKSVPDKEAEKMPEKTEDKKNLIFPNNLEEVKTDKASEKASMKATLKEKTREVDKNKDALAKETKTIEPKAKSAASL